MHRRGQRGIVNLKALALIARREHRVAPPGRAHRQDDRDVGRQRGAQLIVGHEHHPRLGAEGAQGLGQLQPGNAIHRHWQRPHKGQELRNGADPAGPHEAGGGRAERGLALLDVGDARDGVGGGLGEEDEEGERGHG